MWLLIDDCRDLHADVIARTADAGRKMLEVGGWEMLMLDHDLGSATDLSGYDVLVWALERGLCPQNVQLVTSNPPGLSRMRAALEGAGYETLDGRNFVLPVHNTE